MIDIQNQVKLKIWMFMLVYMNNYRITYILTYTVINVTIK